MSDSELAMLEQLCYLEGSIGKYLGIEGRFNGIHANDAGRGLTVEQLLEAFDDKALAKLDALGNNFPLDKNGNKVAWSSGKELADVIRYLKDPSHPVSQLVLEDTMVSDGTTLALTFTDSSGEAYVAFKGTSGSQEWVDNVQGLNQADTQAQQDALNYINGLPYDSITVTGHSKGANKGMYVAITSDKVHRCVVFDGQGFSEEFLEKYAAEIVARGGSITNYSIKGDYVHALLFQIPHSHQIYCEGYGLTGSEGDYAGQLHAPNTFFMQDKYGHLMVDENGRPMMKTGVKEEAGITMLHEFVVFVMQNADDREKVKIVDLVSQLASTCFGGDFSSDKILEILQGDQKTLALVVAYLARFMKENDYDSYEVNDLLDTLGLNSLDEYFTIEVLGIKIVGLSGIINLVIENLNDDDDDFFIQRLLPIVQFFAMRDLGIDLQKLWERANKKAKAIEIAPAPSFMAGKTLRDFSVSRYETLLNAACMVRAVREQNFSAWYRFIDEPWFERVGGRMLPNVLQREQTDLRCASDNAIARIQDVFEQVWDADSRCAQELNDAYHQLIRITNGLIHLRDSIVPKRS